MCYFKIILILINFVFYCNGCIRNTAAQIGPTITTRAMFPPTTTVPLTTTTLTTTTTTACPNPCGAVPADATVLVSQTADASCTYTTTVSCVNSAQTLEFNMIDPQIVPTVMLTCNLVNPLMPFYEYPSITGPLAVTSIRCI